MILTSDKILQADDLKRKKIDVPEWGGEIYVREMTGIESLEFDAWLADNKDNKKVLAVGWHPLMVTLCACDDKGERLFSMADFEAIRKKNKTVLERIADAAIKLNKLGADDLEEEAKNSQGKASLASVTG